MCKKVSWSAMGLTMAALVAVSSCTLGGTDYFSDYRNANLIEDAGKGLSDFGLGYSAQAVGLGSYPYASFSRITDTDEYGSSDGLPAGAEVYRLAVASLLANGDFEEGDIAHWSATGSGTVSIVDASVPDGHQITGDSLEFSLPMDQRLSLDLTATDVVADGLVPMAEYVLNFDFNADPTIAYAFFSFRTDVHSPDGWEVKLNELGGPDYGLWTFPESTKSNGRFTIPDGASTAFFQIGKEAFQQHGRIDNVRLARSDIQPYVDLSLAVAESNPERPIVGGDYYDFSVYVKPELDANVTPQTPGAYRANGITLWFNDSVYAEYADTWPEGRWTKVSHRFRLSDLALPEDTSEPAIRLRISPTVYSDQDAGSLLIAAPHLEFNPPLD